LSLAVIRAAVPGLSLALLVAACGAAQQRTTTTTAVLAGWRSVADPPGISQLAPDLSGLDVTGRTDVKALVRDGDAIRAATFTFATATEAAEARKRGAGDDYQRALEQAFRGDTVARGPSVGLRLHVPRPTGSGFDTAEVYLLAHGRTLTVVELESENGFDPGSRARILRLFSR
jgi:hypothetical protein